ncbi:MAG: SMP-30/gluconolactonase/LRE family protein [Cyanobium sp.]
MTRHGSIRRAFLSLAALVGLAGSAVPLPAHAAAAGAVPCPDLITAVKPLKTGFKWTEGPAWDPRGQRWIFSDLMAETEYAITPAGQLTPLRRQAGYPNGHALLADGSFIVAQHDRTLGRVNADGTGYQVLASTFQGKKLNSPNDVVVAANGDVYFSDPIFGIDGYGPAKAKPELPFRGVFRWRNGNLTLISDQIQVPNGVGLSPNGSTLYVSETTTNTIYTINLNDFQGRPLPAKPLFKFEQIAAGHPAAQASDGLRVDGKGRIWATGPGGIGVYTVEGKRVCEIPFHDHVANLAPGGKDNRQILVTSADKVYLINLRQAF